MAEEMSSSSRQQSDARDVRHPELRPVPKGWSTKRTFAASCQPWGFTVTS